MIRLLVISNYRTYHTARPEAEIILDLRRHYSFDVTVMSYDDAYYRPIMEEAGITYIPWHPDKKADADEVTHLRNHLLSSDYDILMLFNSRAIYTGLASAKNIDIKIVLYRGYTGGIYWWNPREYQKFLHPAVDLIICNSSGVEDAIKVNSVFTKPATTTINKGHDTDWYDVNAINRREIGVNKSTFLICMLANAQSVKGIKFLMKSVKYLPTEADMRILCIGNGYDKYKKYLPNKKSHLVKFLGFRKDALQILATADASILPSTRGESITKSVIEAMSLSLPVIITDIPGNRELIEDGIEGIKVPRKNPEKLANAILTLYRNPKMSEKMGKKAFLRIKNHFNHDKSVKKYAEALSEVVKK